MGYSYGSYAMLCNLLWYFQRSQIPSSLPLIHSTCSNYFVIFCTYFVYVHEFHQCPLTSHTALWSNIQLNGQNRILHETSIFCMVQVYTKRSKQGFFLNVRFFFYFFLLEVGEYFVGKFKNSQVV